MEPDRPTGRHVGVESAPVPVPADALPRRERSVPAPAVQLSSEAGDEASFCDFYRSSRDSVARAFQRWAKVQAMASPAGWVYRVAFNWAVSALRRRRRPPRAPMAAEAPTAGPMAEPDVARALAELDVRQRSVVVCRYLLGWSESQTAAALGTPVGTVKSRLHRASRLLAVRLSHLRPEEDAQ
jgi:RNA polymerase sigma factor (sigma-70 family)